MGFFFSFVIIIDRWHIGDFRRDLRYANCSAQSKQKCYENYEKIKTNHYVKIEIKRNIESNARRKVVK